MLNTICLQGRLARDPELKTSQSGVTLCNYTIACDRFEKGENVADFFNCVAFNKSAEFVEKYFKKGDLILVQGQLQTSKYVDKNGNNRIDYKIVTNSVNFCGGKNDTRKTPTGKDVPKKANDPFEEIVDEELPF